MYKLHLLEQNECGGFYKDGIHSYIPDPHINITTDLWSKLLELGHFKLVEEIENRVYDLNDIKLFEKIIQPTEDVPQEPSLEYKVLILQQELAVTQDALNEILFNI